MGLICCICGNEYNSNKSLSAHIWRTHKMSLPDYYDRYLRKDVNEGICPICKKSTKFISLSRGYQKFCSVPCSNKDEEKNIKSSKVRKENLNNLKDGDLTPSEKARLTREKRYGDGSYGLYGSKSFKDNMVRKYGNVTYNNIEKIRKTNLDRYGVDCNFKIPGFREESERVKKEKYGKAQNLTKLRETNLKRFGTEYYVNTQEFKDKAKKVKEDKSLKRMKDRLKKCSIDVLEVVSYLSCKGVRCKCSVCGNEFQYSYSFLYGVLRSNLNDICPFCNPRKANYDSAIQKDIEDYIKSLYGGVISYDNRSVLYPYELDIFIPEKSIAFEIDGVYWHSVVYKDNNYHLNKTEKCSSLGIRLYHIFDSEWVTKNDIVKSRISSLFGVFKNKIYARKCDIKVVSSDDERLFLEENHLQGYTPSKIRFGLYYQNELVSLMTFGKPRFNKNYSWELLRLCSKKYCIVVGGASKLLSYFESRYSGSIISYADRRWSNGKVYYKLGFKFIENSKPNYWYFKSSYLLESRIKYQKHKLKDLLTVFDNNLTEKENMMNNGYLYIYDCGNMTFIKER